MNNLNLIELKKVISKISLNNLISILLHHQVEPENIKFVPVFADSSSTPTILNIYKKADNIYIEINLFKINIFSKLEGIYQYYLQNEYDEYIEFLKENIQIFIHIYVFGSYRYQTLIRNNLYKRASADYTINNIINMLYTALAGEYVSIITYDKSIDIVPSKPNYINEAYINDIYLGGILKSYIYTVKIEVFFLTLSSLKNNIDRIKNKISLISKSMKDIKLGKIDIIINPMTLDNPKSLLNYIGEYKITD